MTSQLLSAFLLPQSIRFTTTPTNFDL